MSRTITRCCLRATFVAEKRLDRALERLNKLPGKYLFLTTLGGMTDENDQVLPQLMYQAKKNGKDRVCSDFR